MIALSDIIILSVSSVLLVVALLRAYSPDDTGTAPDTVSQVTQQPASPVQTGTTSNSSSTALTTTAQTAATGTTDNNQVVVQQPAAVPTEPPAPTPEILYDNYTVRSGDSLSVIASRTGTSVRQLQDINQLSTTVIQIGQVLRYPKP